MNCKHDAHITLDNLIRCRICGDMLTESEETLSKIQSLVGARRIQDSVAAAQGGYKISAYDDKFVTYTRTTGSVVEQLIVRRDKPRQYSVIKKNFTL